jgi:hypothetical protein
MVATLCRGDWFTALGYSEMAGLTDQWHSVTPQRMWILKEKTDEKDVE